MDITILVIIQDLNSHNKAMLKHYEATFPKNQANESNKSK